MKKRPCANRSGTATRTSTYCVVTYYAVNTDIRRCSIDCIHIVSSSEAACKRNKSSLAVIFVPIFT